MDHLTIQDVPPELARALEQESLRLREPIEQTVITLLRQALNVRVGGGERNGLARLAGTWTEAEHQDFENAIALTEQLDEELWR